MPFAKMAKENWLQVIAAYVGWLMDGYTTIAYALVAVTISTVFFPSTIGIFGLIATFGGFAVEALARPIGSLVMGNYLGDKMGRKTMLTLTILGFSVMAASKGLLPTYSQIGIIAPFLLYIILFIEGMFAGAEYGGGTALSMESVPKKYRLPIGAFVQSGFGTGYFIIAFVFAGIYGYFGSAVFATIGWRFVFYTTIIPGILTLLIRLIAKETKVFNEMKEKKEIEKIPIKSLVVKGGKPLIFALFLTSGLLFINTATFSFYPSLFLEKFPNISGSLMGYYVGLINLVSLFGVWIGGLIGIKVLKRKMLTLSYTILFIILTFPIAYMAFMDGDYIMFIAFSIQAFLEAMIFAALPAFLSETFSKKFRTTGVGFAYNGGAIFGGFAISIILSTYAAINNLMFSWTIWLIIGGILTLIGIVFSKETYYKDEEKDSIDE